MGAFKWRAGGPLKPDFGLSGKVGETNSDFLHELLRKRICGDHPWKRSRGRAALPGRVKAHFQ